MKASAYFERHAQTLVGSLGRIAQQPMAAFMTMAVIAVALALPLFLNLLLQNARVATGNLNEAFDLSVYMDKKADAARVQAVTKQLRLRGDVAAVRVITADEALSGFRENSGFGKALDALTENPLPDTLIVTPTLEAGTVEGTDNLRNVIAALADVQSVQVDTAWIQRLHAILEVLRRTVMLTAGLLALGIVLIVSNTIRLDILNRRAEIEVMKLVGASDGFARRPFLYSGIWYGLGGGLLALILVEIAAQLLAPRIEQLAQFYGSTFRLDGLGLALGAGVLGLAVALAWLGSWITATQHIRSIEPT